MNWLLYPPNKLFRLHQPSHSIDFEESPRFRLKIIRHTGKEKVTLMVCKTGVPQFIT